jgi:RNA recognition motif-containing protein
MATKLYVGGLPYSTTSDELKDHFAQAGAVTSATVIMDKMSGRSKGFGFVEMSSEAEAQNAISMFNGQDFGGRNLTVNEARPMEPRAPRTGGGGGGFNRGGSSGGRY